MREEHVAFLMITSMLDCLPRPFLSIVQPSTRLLIISIHLELQNKTFS